MNNITFTLLSDGSSDRALLPIIEWALKKECPNLSVRKEWADLRRLPYPPQKLWDRIIKTIEYYPCDILFIHRDAEKESLGTRLEEIKNALQEAEKIGFKKIAIPIIPVRMTEAWLLIDEKAIRKASGNPNGRNRIDIPPIRELEQLPNPKKILHKLLRTASGLQKRQLKTFDTEHACNRISFFCADFSHLLKLPAFQHFINDVEKVCQSIVD
ncbi:MAG: DUF4276 family protein [Desulfobacteraceae bacterium]|nr:MAG: DUF4276 family protein [Desulfobacteraceae bacterium]